MVGTVYLAEVIEDLMYGDRPYPHTIVSFLQAISLLSMSVIIAVIVMSGGAD